MLKKLLKHEFRATARVMGPLFLIVLALALTANLSLHFLLDARTFFPNLMGGLLMVAFFVGMAGLAVMSVVLMVNRFRKNLMGDEGYVMFTLPVSGHQLVWSKIIVSTVWFIAAAIVEALAMLVCFFDLDWLREIFSSEFFRRALQELNGEKEKQNLFFNSATHQLKTPLTSIIGYSEIIQRMTEKEDVVTSARYIEAAGKSLLETVENIISISRYNKAEYDPDPSWFQLDDLCRECSALLLPRLERSNIVLNSRCGDIQVYFDRQRLKEAIFNVLDNCILHSGCTQISVSSATWPVRLIIEDNGKGIAPQQLERVFEPFYRPAGAARGGSGLGLAICKTIMQAHGGDARVESSQGRGTRTTLIFGEETGPPPERRRL